MARVSRIAPNAKLNFLVIGGRSFLKESQAAVRWVHSKG
jgi:hypothetical protein